MANPNPTRVTQVADFVLKWASSKPLWTIVEELEMMGYNEPEIKLGIRAAVEIILRP